MLRLYATFVKELQLLLKDKTGLTVLFIMPVMLVIIMTLIQNEVYKSLNETGIPVLLVNHDKGRLGTAIENGFSQNAVCQLTVDHGENYTSTQAVQQKVLDGEFLVALVIPENASSILQEDVEGMMDAFLADDTSISTTDIFQEIHFQIIVDPVARKSFVIAISSTLREMVSAVKTKVMFELISGKMNNLMGAERDIDIPDADFFIFDEVSAVASKGDTYVPNAVQHNVPAWAIFSIFFIVLPLAGSIISEKSTGVYMRMHTFPGNYLSILSGKLLTYILVAFAQFVMVILLGVYVMPAMGLPHLDVGHHLMAMFILTVAVAASAVSYGFLVGTVFDTPQQSAIFGGISVLIMSALGGIWVPLNIMPPLMQQIANLFPLNWALKGYYELFIKDGGWGEIQLQVLKLSLFFVLAVGLSYYFYRVKRKLD